MAPWITWVGLATTALLSSGCGTVRNLHPPSESIAGDPKKRVYGGVEDNCENIKYNSDSSNPRMLYPVTIALCLIDLPLCAIGDTITLPYTLAYDRRLFGFRCVYEPSHSDAVLSSLPRGLESDVPRENGSTKQVDTQP
ncbi:MAG: YceK/YidQ family lipoprotein [Planctomycetes bacterium]|nr:YceK/YidQ family lipoprotein [Planctomycetota bacterium]